MTDFHELLFGNTSERLDFALKLFEKTLDDLEQDLQIMKQWVKTTQPHLVEIPRKVFKTMLIVLYQIDK